MDKILVVDDETAICELVKGFLTRVGYNVITALSGEEALLKVENESLSLVLLDIKMPGMDGLEVLRRIREKSGTLTVIMMTAVTEEDVARKALVMGANDYITKPIDLKYLETSVFVSVNLSNQQDA